MNVDFEKILGVAVKQISIQCDKHGSSRISLIKIGNQWRGNVCPKCAQEREEKKRLEEIYKKRQEEAQQLKLISGIPSLFINATLSQYKPTCDRAYGVLRNCENYIETWKEKLKNGSGAIFLGGVGTGKTHLACAIGLELIYRYNANVRYLTFDQLVRSVRSTYSHRFLSEQDLIDYYLGVDLLIIDDVSMRPVSEHNKSLFFEIVDGRYCDRKPIIFVSNKVINYLAQAWGDLISDRVRNMCTIFTFDWNSYRGEVNA